MPWFKLLVGTHIQEDLSAKPDARGVHPERVYHAGDVFESNTDLRALNGIGMTPKFERVDVDNAPQNLRRAAEEPKPSRGEWPGSSVPQPSQYEANAPLTGDPKTHALGEPPTGRAPIGSGEQVAGASAPQRPAYSGGTPGRTEGVEPPKAVSAKRDLDKDYGPLDKMSVNELREVAESEEIDLKGASKKEDIIKALRST